MYYVYVRRRIIIDSLSWAKLSCAVLHVPHTNACGSSLCVWPKLGISPFRFQPQQHCNNSLPFSTYFKNDSARQAEGEQVAWGTRHDDEAAENVAKITAKSSTTGKCVNWIFKQFAVSQRQSQLQYQTCPRFPNSIQFHSRYCACAQGSFLYTNKGYIWFSMQNVKGIWKAQVSKLSELNIIGEKIPCLNNISFQRFIKLIINLYKFINLYIHIYYINVYLEG